MTDVVFQSHAVHERATNTRIGRAAALVLFTSNCFAIIQQEILLTARVIRVFVSYSWTASLGMVLLVNYQMASNILTRRMILYELTGDRVISVINAALSNVSSVWSMVHFCKVAKNFAIS